MKQIFLFLLFLTCSFISRAQDRKAIEQLIRNKEQLGVKGILESDTSLLKTLWHPSFIVNTPHNNIAYGREAVFLNQKKGLISYSSFSRIVEAIEFHGDVVITMGYETFVSKNDIPGVKAGVEVKRRFTNIWMLKENNWVQVGRHASVICI